MTDNELGRALVAVFSDLERDDLEHTVGCDECGLFEDREYGRYRCENNPAEIRERRNEDLRVKFVGFPPNSAVAFGPYLVGPGR